MTDLCICGHPRPDHRHDGENQHATYTYLGDCQTCGCPGFGLWVEDTTDGDSDDVGADKVECTVCGEFVGRGPGGLGTTQHANRHRREFVGKFGRKPENYDEVRQALGRGYIVADAEQLTLAEASDERAREARHDDGQATLEDGGRE